jgi:peptide/nickel transport system substrate-binding protein
MSSKKTKKKLSMKEALESVQPSRDFVKDLSKKKKDSIRDWLWDYPVNLIKAFKKFAPSSFIVLFSLLGIALFIFLTSNTFAFVFSPKKTSIFVEGSVGAISTFNPIFLTQNPVDSDIHALVFEKFIKISKDGTPKVGIATDWVKSSDGVIYEFTISSDHKWQDGEPLTVEDVLFTFEISKELAQKFNYDTIGVPLLDVKIEKISNEKMRFTLPESNATFFEAVSVYIIPKHKFEDVRLEDIPFDVFARFPVGSGPFEVYRSEPNVVYLKASDNYYMTPKIETFVYRLYSDYSSLEAAFRNGVLDAMGGTDGTSMDFFKEYSGYDIYLQTLYSRLRMIFFNTRKEKLENKDIRRALNYLTDKELLLQKAMISGFLTYGPIHENSWAYSDSNVVKYDYDQQKAKEILNNLGYFLNETSGYYETEDKKILNFTLSYYDNNFNGRITQALKELWREEGIVLELEPLTYTQLTQEIVATRDYELLMYEIETTIDPDQYNLWHSLKSNYPDLNLSGYSYERVDILLEESRKTLEREKRILNYELFQKYLTQDSPAIFLYHPNYTYIVRDSIEIDQISEIIYPYQRFDDIASWSY